MVSAKLFLKDGCRTQNIARICLNMDGQKNKSDNTTHLLWKTILMKLHLQKGDDGRRTGTLFFFKTKEGKQGPMRQRPGFRETKQAHRQLFKIMLKVPAKELIPSIQQIKQDNIIENNLKVPRSTTTWFTLELDGNIILQQVRLHPRNGSSIMMIGSRIKVGILGDLQPGLKSNVFFGRNHEHRRTCCKK